MTRSAAVRVAVEAVEARTLFAAPALDSIPAFSVPVGKTIQIPVTSSSDAGAVSYSVRSSSTSAKGGYRTGATYIQMNVAGYSQPMVFQLFGDTAPDTVRRITGLINSKFYDGLTFHRILDNFVIQGGDPKGDGSGGPGFTFDDEFSDSTYFTGTGQLAMANSGKDTNGSQFFITEGPQRLLDFNHTIFGQLIRGEATRQAISNTAVDSNGSPTGNDVVISSVRVINDPTDNVLLMKGLAAGTYTVKVTATNADGSTAKNFQLTVTSPDTINDPPILNTSTLSPVYYTTVGKPVTLDLSSIDPEGTGSNFFVGQFVTQNDAQGAFGGTNQNKITITPTKAGLISIKVGVIGSSTDSTRGSTSLASGDNSGISIADSQTIRIAVGDLPISAAAYDVEVNSGAANKNLLVGYFKDSDASAVAASNTAQIDWGDGTVTTGMVSKTRNGRFAVYANKTYASKVTGTVPITLTVTGADGAYARATSTAVVRQSVAVANGNLTINGTSADDRIGVDRKSSNYVVSINGVTTSYPISSVTQILANGFAGADIISMTARVLAKTFIDGGDGNDNLTGGDGDDVINAGAGDDTVYTAGGSNRVAGVDGNDTLTGGAGRDRIFGGTGNDSINGGSGRDILSGDEGDDIVIGNASNDFLYGGIGNDILNGSSGADNIDGGDGRDTYKADILDTVVNVEVAV